LSLFAP